MPRLATNFLCVPWPAVGLRLRMAPSATCSSHLTLSTSSVYGNANWAVDIGSSNDSPTLANNLAYSQPNGFSLAGVNDASLTGNVAHDLNTGFSVSGLRDLLDSDTAYLDST